MIQVVRKMSYVLLEGGQTMIWNMRSLNAFEDLGLERSLMQKRRLRACQLAKLYYLVRGRNAWHNLRSNVYLTDRSFHLSLQDAKTEAERLRKQGSTWTIKELPACAFHSRKRTLLVTEINTPRPLESFCGASAGLHGSSLFSVAVCFSPPKPNSILRFLTPFIDFPEPTGMFRTFRSRSRRGTMAWREIELNPNFNLQPHYVFRICELVSQHVRSERAIREGASKKVLE